MNDGYVPVIAPFGTCDETGESLNINADNSTIEIALVLKSSKLIFLTETNGVMQKTSNDKERVISKIKTSEIPFLIEKNVIYGGMIPKILSCRKSIDKGIENIHIISGKIEHSILIELFTNAGIGTIIVKG